MGGAGEPKDSCNDSAADRQDTAILRLGLDPNSLTLTVGVRVSKSSTFEMEDY